MLIFLKVTDGEIHDWDWPLIKFCSAFGPITSAILIIYGLGYLLITIPYRIIFGKGIDE